MKKFAIIISIIFVLTATFLIAFYVFVIKDYKSPDLANMLESPMGNIEINSGEVFDMYYNDTERVFMPNNAEVTIRYRPKEGYTKEDVFDEILGEMRSILDNTPDIVYLDTSEDDLVKIKERGWYSKVITYKQYTTLTIEILRYKEENAVGINIRDHNASSQDNIILQIKNIIDI